MKRYNAPEIIFETLNVRDIVTVSGAAEPTAAPTAATGSPTEATFATSPSGNGIVLPEDTFG